MYQLLKFIRIRDPTVKLSVVLVEYCNRASGSHAFGYTIYVGWEGTPRRYASYKAVCLSVA